MAERRVRQHRVTDWIIRVLGAGCARDPRERALRFVEEAIELGQACGLAPEDVQALSARVFTRPAGELRQEIGGVGVTLLALGECVGIDVDTEEERELTRVESADPEGFRRKQAEKTAQGLTADSPDSKVRADETKRIEKEQT